MRADRMFSRMLAGLPAPVAQLGEGDRQDAGPAVAAAQPCVVGERARGGRVLRALRGPGGRGGAPSPAAPPPRPRRAAPRPTPTVPWSS